MNTRRVDFSGRNLVPASLRGKEHFLCLLLVEWFFPDPLIYQLV